MDWIDRAILVGATTAGVLTIQHLARTIKSVMSNQPASAHPPTDGFGPSGEADAPPRIWADDVLAEEERERRDTRGAADHSSDVCTWWEEEDERQARDEVATRLIRSRRSP